MNLEPIQDKPEDLSISKSAQLSATGPNEVHDIYNKNTKSSKTTSNNPTTTTVKKVKPIPPPLDLAACNNLDNSNDVPSDLRTPKSPGDLPRECLPLRKR